MLTIRLSRTGKKKAPQYRIVLMEKHRDPWSPAKEILGHYNPRAEKDGVVLKQDRIEYWLSQGAQPSNTVHNMLVNAGILKADKQKSVTISNKRTAKINEKNAEAEEKKREAEEKVKAAAEAEAAEKAQAEAAEKEAAEKVPAEEPQTTEESPTETEAPVDETTETPSEKAAA